MHNIVGNRGEVGKGLCPSFVEFFTHLISFRSWTTYQVDFVYKSTSGGHTWWLL